MKLFMLFLICLPATSVLNAYSATAHWTGSQRQVTTPTGRPALACEYEYGGNRFWREFTDTGICPGSIEVE